MSRKLGDKIPKEVHDLVGLEVDARKSAVIQLYTVDDNGFPHTCLLSPYQIVSPDEKGKEIKMLVYSASTTSSNLNKRKKGTLVFFIPPKAFYVKGVVMPTQSKIAIDSETMYSIIVQEASVDYSADSPINSALTFDDSRIRTQYERNFKEVIKALQLEKF